MQAVLRLYKDVDGYIRENYNTVRGETQNLCHCSFVGNGYIRS